MDLETLPMISKPFIDKHLSAKELAPALEEMFKSFRDGHGTENEISQPVRTTVNIKRHKGKLMSMPAYVGATDSLSIKLLTSYPNNHTKGLPGVQAIVVLFNSLDGKPKALLEGSSLSAVRTSVATAVATKFLACKDARILAIIGTGVEAVGHIKAFRELHNFQEIRIYGRTSSKCRSLAKETGCIPCDTIEEAVKDADVVTTVTTATKPIIEKKWLKSNALLNVVGACVPSMREASDELMKTSQLIADTKDGAEQESGDFLATGVKVDGELGDVICGKFEPDFSKIRLFKSQGMGAEDAVAADIVYKKIHGAKMMYNEYID